MQDFRSTRVLQENSDKLNHEATEGRRMTIIPEKFLITALALLRWKQILHHSDAQCVELQFFFLPLLLRRMSTCTCRTKKNQITVSMTIFWPVLAVHIALKGKYLPFSRVFWFLVQNSLHHSRPAGINLRALSNVYTTNALRDT